jgi:hypothetical protein
MVFRRGLKLIPLSRADIWGVMLGAWGKRRQKYHRERRECFSQLLNLSGGREEVSKIRACL